MVEGAPDKGDILSQFDRGTTEINSLLEKKQKTEALAAAIKLKTQLERYGARDTEVNERLQNLSGAIKALQAPPEQSAGLKAWKASMGIVACLVAFALTVAVGSKAKTYMAYESYKTEALQTIDDLEKLKALATTGVTFDRFSEKLGEVTHQVQKFEEKHYDFPSAHEISDAAKAYQDSADLWREHPLNVTRPWDSDAQALQLLWRKAGDGLSTAKDLINLKRR